MSNPQEDPDIILFEEIPPIPLSPPPGSNKYKMSYLVVFLLVNAFAVTFLGIAIGLPTPEAALEISGYHAPDFTVHPGYACNWTECLYPNGVRLVFECALAFVSCLQVSFYVVLLATEKLQDSIQYHKPAKSIQHKVIVAQFVVLIVHLCLLSTIYRIQGFTSCDLRGAALAVTQTFSIHVVTVCMQLGYLILYLGALQSFCVGRIRRERRCFGVQWISNVLENPEEAALKRDPTPQQLQSMQDREQLLEKAFMLVTFLGVELSELYFAADHYEHLGAYVEYAVYGLTDKVSFGDSICVPNSTLIRVCEYNAADLEPGFAKAHFFFACFSAALYITLIVIVSSLIYSKSRNDKESIKTWSILLHYASLCQVVLLAVGFFCSVVSFALNDAATRACTEITRPLKIEGLACYSAVVLVEIVFIVTHLWDEEDDEELEVE